MFLIRFSAFPYPQGVNVIEPTLPHSSVTVYGHDEFSALPFMHGVKVNAPIVSHSSGFDEVCSALPSQQGVNVNVPILPHSSVTEVGRDKFSALLLCMVPV